MVTAFKWLIYVPGYSAFGLFALIAFSGYLARQARETKTYFPDLRIWHRKFVHWLLATITFIIVVVLAFAHFLPALHANPHLMLLLNIHEWCLAPAFFLLLLITIWKLNGDKFPKHRNPAYSCISVGVIADIVGLYFAHLLPK